MYLLAFFIAFNLINFIFIYNLKIPNLISNEDKLVEEYYYNNTVFNYFFDLLLYVIYFEISDLISYYFEIREIAYKLLILIITTIIISGLAMIYFINNKSNLFFSRWFNKVKFKGVIYDCVILSITYLAYQRLIKQIYNK